MNDFLKLLSVAAEDLAKLLSVAACACEHEMHFPIFPYQQQFLRPRARKQHLAATDASPNFIRDNLIYWGRV